MLLSCYTPRFGWVVRIKLTDQLFIPLLLCRLSTRFDLSLFKAYQEDLLLLKLVIDAFRQLLSQVLVYVDVLLALVNYVVFLFQVGYKVN